MVIRSPSKRTHYLVVGSFTPTSLSDYPIGDFKNRVGESFEPTRGVKYLTQESVPQASESIHLVVGSFIQPFLSVYPIGDFKNRVGESIHLIVGSFVPTFLSVNPTWDFKNQVGDFKNRVGESFETTSGIKYLPREAIYLAGESIHLIVDSFIPHFLSVYSIGDFKNRVGESIQSTCVVKYLTW